MTFDKGDAIQLSARFVDASEALTDPSAVVLKIVAPSATNSYTYGSSAIVKDSTGLYHFDLTPAESGIWRYSWTATGTVTAVEEGEFLVRYSRT